MQPAAQAIDLWALGDLLLREFRRSAPGRHTALRGLLGFGGGVHGCLGSLTARIAINIVFEEFRARFPQFSRADSALERMPSTTFRSPLALKLDIH